MADVNSNSNWGTCIAPPIRRPRVHHRVNPYLGAHRQNETEMFLDHDEMSLSIAAVSALSVACSMLAVQQQKRLCRQFFGHVHGATRLPHDEACSELNYEWNCPRLWDTVVCCHWRLFSGVSYWQSDGVASSHWIRWVCHYHYNNVILVTYLVSVCIHQRTTWTLAMTMSWWQHHKLYQQYYFILLVL